VDIGDRLGNRSVDGGKGLLIKVGPGYLRPDVMSFGDYLVAQLCGHSDPGLHDGDGVHDAIAQRQQAVAVLDPDDLDLITRQEPFQGLDN